MTASIMMVTYNRLELTQKTVQALLRNTNYPFNLIIVDNGSTDGTVEYLNEKSWIFDSDHLCKAVKLQINDRNLGIAVARNQALLLAEDNWLATLDNDVLVPNGWLKESIDILSANPDYGMIGVNMEDVTYPIIQRNGLSWQSKPQGNLGTACTVFPRSLHKLLGFFNTEYGLYGEEDADFGMRVRVVGLKLGYIKENGNHIGQGENDLGEYRQFKTESHTANLKKFNENCRAYVNHRKGVYVPFNK